MEREWKLMGSRNRKDPVQQSPVGQGDRGVQDLGGGCKLFPPCEWKAWLSSLSSEPGLRTWNGISY